VLFREEFIFPKPHTFDDLLPGRQAVDDSSREHAFLDGDAFDR
jgi:hypothetical protein